MGFCAVIGGASCVLGVRWKSAFAEFFVFAPGGATAPTGVERRTEGSAAQGSRNAVEVGLGLIEGLVAEFLTAISLLQIVPTEEKSK